MKAFAKHGLGVLSLLLGLCASLFPATQVFSAIANTPLFLTQAVDPRLMLVMSRDHQLYIKAYTDYSDLDDDGSLDTTYNDAVEYYGYFDSKKCYTYINSRFEPASAAAGPNFHHCSSQWSGNFLNWATMTRMDVIRKVLYGGFRRQDGTQTVLERAFLPYDAHAFAKVFTTSNTTEMQKYVPFAQTTISLCNLTHATGSSQSVDTSANPPLLRIASGNGSGTVGWPYWSASEKPECIWAGQNTQPPATNRLLLPEPAGSGNNTDGYFVRVLVCDSGQEESNCKTYPSGNKKPIGLLQKYGEADKPMRFGLMTGSYTKNKSGGVLRKNISKLIGNSTASLNEIDSNSGQFVNQTPTDAGIINTLNRFRIAGYNYTSTLYDVGSCNSAVIPIFSDGQCIDWGNPLSEIYLETLRYFSGKTSPSFPADDSAYIPSLPQVTWSDPIPSQEWCAHCSVVAISTGLSSFDTDQLSNDIGIDAASQTNIVGDSNHENINGGSYLIGENGIDNNQQCTGKLLGALSSASGICPEVPHWKGGYHIGGLAYNAHIQDLRTDRTSDQKIDTYAIALAESLPRFNIPVGGGTVTILPACQGNDLSDAGTGTWRPCDLVDVAIESVNYDSSGKPISGSLVINWDASQWGFDFDMDATERLQFCVGAACSPAINSNEINVTASLFQTALGRAIRVGYTITGSTADGMHFPVMRMGSGAGGSNFTILPNVLNCFGTSPCPPIQTTKFTQGTFAARLLENPLWYTAKYGSFIEVSNPKNDRPDLQAEWDADSNGVPDGFFKASNPAKLEAALDNIFSDVIKRTSAASAVATSSTRLDTNTVIYQAKFDTGNWGGSLLAFGINPDGSIGNQLWDAAARIPDTNDRKIFSYNPSTSTACSPSASSGTKGISFQWNNLNCDQRNSLKLSGETDYNNAQLRLNYLRGDQSQEQKNGGVFRNRSVLLGDIVNSDPWFVGSENFGYGDIRNPTDPTNTSDPVNEEGASYTAFRSSTDYMRRRRMIYVGGNDGMLHAFDAGTYFPADTSATPPVPEHFDTGTGAEIFAYVPNAVFGNLSALASPTYSHKYFVDGSPRSGDAYIDVGSGKNWRTILLGTTGAGGKGVFALDITSPDSFSASNVLWEISDTSSPFSADLLDVISGSKTIPGLTKGLGYTLPQPSIARMANGSWAAIVANGYGSVINKAVLYIINVQTGQIIKTIDTGAAGSSTSPNGLSTPITVDVDNNRIVDYIYAGDLLGNLWKFDVRDSNPNNWDVAYSGSAGEPLFTATDSAGNRQPITAKPQVGRVEASQTGGVMVYFGTGKYFEDGDNSPPDSQCTDPNVNPKPPKCQVHTFYGLWDKNTGNRNTDEISGRNSLQKQTILEEGKFGTQFDLRVTSDNSVNYASGSNQKQGWFMDLIKPPSPPGTKEGERVVSFALLRGGRIIFSTLIPSPNPCDFGGTGWLMELDAVTGSRLATSGSPPWDIYGSGGKPDGAINSQDLVRSTTSAGCTSADCSPSGKKSSIGIIKTPGVISGGDKEYKYTSGSSGALEATTESAGGAGGRQSWRQLR